MDAERLKDLLFVYLNDSLNQEEYDELLTYINDETYSGVFYETMDQEWKRDAITALLTEADQKAAYQNITSDPRFSTSGLNHPQPNRSRWFGPRTMSAAAVIAIISLGLYFITAKFYQGESQYVNDVNPGSTKAVLTLADGRKIILDSVQKGALAEQAGISVSKTADGKLVYTLTDKPVDQQNDDLTYNTLETPNGGEYQLNLPDGTKIWLNAGSTLKYPTSFEHAKERKVTLNGEAYFEVAHNKDLPFRVVTDKQLVEVLGTHFNINAYEIEPNTETTLLEGSVKVAQNGNGKELLLKPGQQSLVGKDFTVAAVDTESVVDWKNGDFNFKDEDLKASMRKIARWYDVEVIYDESAPEDLQLGGWVSRSKNISAVLKVIESTGKVHFKVQGRRVTVTK